MVSGSYHNGQGAAALSDSWLWRYRTLHGPKASEMAFGCLSLTHNSGRANFKVGLRSCLCSLTMGMLCGSLVYRLEFVL